LNRYLCTCQYLCISLLECAVKHPSKITGTQQIIEVNG
jgi:hypothetical protein